MNESSRNENGAMTRGDWGAAIAISLCLLLAAVLLLLWRNDWAFSWETLPMERMFKSQIEQWKVGSSALGILVLALVAMGQRGWKILTSLRVTVWTLLLSAFLVFFGSLAQVQQGLADGQALWFKEWLVHVNLTWSKGATNTIIQLYLPGGHLLGTVLLVNLLAAHFKRFSWHFQKVGIQLVHLGIILLLVGQFLTDKLSKESVVRFREGETKHYSADVQRVELAFSTDTADAKELVVAIPQEVVESYSASQAPIVRGEMPFTARVVEFGPNADIMSRRETLTRYAQLSGGLAKVDGQFGGGDLPTLADDALTMPGRVAVWRDSLIAIGEKPADDLVAVVKRVAGDPASSEKLRTELKTRFRRQMIEANLRQGGSGGFAALRLQSGKPLTEADLPAAASDGLGADVTYVPRPKAVDMKAENTPYAIVELSRDGKPLGKFFTYVSQLWDPQVDEFQVDGKTWRIQLRPERTYLPFSLTLQKATHEVYPGTDKPKDYRSLVLVENTVTGERHESEIYMNHPWRPPGLTLYQHQMGLDQRGFAVKFSGLQVVENPGWLTPYAGCYIVGLGLLWQFLWHFSKFFSKRAGLPPPELSHAHPLLPIAAVAFILPDLYILLFHGFGRSSGLTIVAIGCTLVVRCVLAWQLARGRYLGFGLVFLSVTTMLLVPFSIKYSQDYGHMLSPLVYTQIFVIAAIATAVLTRKSTSPAKLP